MTLHLFSDVVSDAELTKKIDDYVIIASMKSEPTCKLINLIPGLHLFTSSLPGSPTRKHVIIASHAS